MMQQQASAQAATKAVPDVIKESLKEEG